MVKGVKSVGVTKVGVALHIDNQLKVGGHFCPTLECGGCGCV